MCCPRSGNPQKASRSKKRYAVRELQFAAKRSDLARSQIGRGIRFWLDFPLGQTRLIVMRTYPCKAPEPYLSVKRENRRVAWEPPSMHRFWKDAPT